MVIGRKQQGAWKTVCILLLLLSSPSLESSRAETKTPETNPLVETTFSGTGEGETELFTVEHGWKVQWETESSFFKLSAHGSAQRPYVGVANEREKVLRWFETVQPIVLANTTKAAGKAYHPFAGTFHLRIVADGPWQISLKTIPDTKDYLDVPYTGAP